MSSAEPTTTTPSDPPTLVALRAHVRALTALHDRLKTLRLIPPRLLRVPGASSSPPSSEAIKPGMQDIADLQSALRGEAVQDALGAARESVRLRGVVVGGGRGAAARKEREKERESKKRK